MSLERKIHAAILIIIILGAALVLTLGTIFVGSLSLFSTGCWIFTLVMMLFSLFFEHDTNRYLHRGFWE